jgi:hypothetical protein
MFADMKLYPQSPYYDKLGKSPKNTSKYVFKDRSLCTPLTRWSLIRIKYQHVDDIQHERNKWTIVNRKKRNSSIDYE